MELNLKRIENGLFIWIRFFILCFLSNEYIIISRITRAMPICRRKVNGSMVFIFGAIEG